jgi:cytochrome b
MPDTPPLVTQKQRRWDPVVKLTHWAVALAVLANAVIMDEGSAAHVWVGYALAAILALRLLWGLIGPAEARFSAFLPSPRTALAHVGDIAAKRLGLARV